VTSARRRAQAPDLLEARERAEADGTPHLILDGKTIDTGRVRVKTLSKNGKEIGLWHSGKTHDFGGNAQAIFHSDGLPWWVSDVLPGNVHDLAAAREQVLDIIRPFTKKMHGVLTPVKQPSDGSELDVDTRTYNRLLRALRCLGERGFALLSQRWRTL
jgi:hypothetical protein